MKIRDVLSGVAGVLVSSNPALPLLVAAVNRLLPKDSLLPADATAQDVERQLLDLPEGDREIVLSQQIDLAKVESWADIQKSHAQTDATGNSARPTIAYMMALTVCASVVPLSVSLTWAIASGDSELLVSIDKAVWPMLALIGTPTVLLKAYFGLRTSEKKARYAASVGQQVENSALSVLLGALNRDKR